ncbi:hypothetical protein K503DRAFT_74043 [Rhizopogon vinicolor AM-OR11-026]|uniref:Uncharacterized protein n=1 Tax=Rhizopogon vinicolor AM-OR11-026 TaxID=1314800 RepID=A0A1B7MG58_9AGAM|nr:hypothetical protein K503DRAFT_74043 [Rhizopogon vinicolor AM-OR11-026]
MTYRLGQDGAPLRLGLRTKTFHRTGTGRESLNGSMLISELRNRVKVNEEFNAYIREVSTSVRAVDFNSGERSSWDPKRSHRYRLLIIGDTSHARQWHRMGRQDDKPSQSLRGRYTISCCPFILQVPRPPIQKSPHYLIR